MVLAQYSCNCGSSRDNSSKGIRWFHKNISNICRNSWLCNCIHSFSKSFTSISEGQKIVDLSLIAEENKYTVQNVREQLGATKVATVLCLPSGSSRQLLTSQINRYKDFQPIIAFTKVDECQLYAREMCVLASKNVKVGFMTGSKTILSSLALSEPTVLATHLDTYITDELNDE